MTKDIAPALIAPPQVTDAPSRGIDPNISGHIAALPNLYELDAQPVEELSPTISRQYLHGSHSTFVKWTMKKGAIVPLHHHVNEQITWITEGACEVYSQGKKFLLARRQPDDHPAQRTARISLHRRHDRHRYFLPAAAGLDRRHGELLREEIGAISPHTTRSPGLPNNRPCRH